MNELRELLVDIYVTARNDAALMKEYRGSEFFDKKLAKLLTSPIPPRRCKECGGIANHCEKTDCEYAITQLDRTSCGPIRDTCDNYGKCPSCSEGLQYAWVLDLNIVSDDGGYGGYRPYTFGDAGKDIIWRGK